jgi:exonuclease III
MKIISWNIRGLGRIYKRKEVWKLVGEKNPLIVCLQETKLQVCDDFLCSSLWGSSSFGFSFRPSSGASGGLLTMWDTTEVEVWSSISRDYVLWCHGRFVKTGEEFLVTNVYAPCDKGAKQGLSDALSTKLQELGGMRVCVCVETLMLSGASTKGVELSKWASTNGPAQKGRIVLGLGLKIPAYIFQGLFSPAR